MTDAPARLPVERRKLPNGKTIYHHPNGYTIRPEERDWSARGTEQPGWAGPKRWWIVKPRFGSRQLASCDSFGEARQWCDEHPPKGEER